jgi:DNA repair protein RadD
MKLRDYQEQAVQHAWRALQERNESLIVAATGAGKSLIAAAIIKRFQAEYPSAKVLVLCYVKEILQSNEEACQQLGITNVGVYCAGLERREINKSVVHASRDSLKTNTVGLSDFDLVMLSSGEDAKYSKLIDTIKPKYLVGMTATPFRLKGGYIYGKRKRFLKVDYNISLDTLVSQQHLVPFIHRDINYFDFSKFNVERGDFVNAEIDRFMNSKEVIKLSLQFWSSVAADRKLSLFFCTSIAHAKAVHRSLCEVFNPDKIQIISSETPSEEREEIINDARDGFLKVIINVNCLSTGTNIPTIDCVVWLRPTMSACLYVQGTGRGSRLSEGKKDCLVLDLVGNLQRFVNVSEPVVLHSGEKKKVKFTNDELLEMGINPERFKGYVTSKECRKCKSIVASVARNCDHCGELFISIATPLIGEETVVTNTEVSTVVTANGKGAYKIDFITSTGAKVSQWLIQEFWNRQKIQETLAKVKLGVKTIIIEPSSNPKFPKVTIAKTQSNLSASHG